MTGDNSDKTDFEAQRLRANEADMHASAITNGKMRIEWDGDGRFHLIHVGKRYEVPLSPNQLTPEGIRQVIAANDPWPGD